MNPYTAMTTSGFDVNLTTNPGYQMSMAQSSYGVMTSLTSTTSSSTVSGSGVSNTATNQDTSASAVSGGGEGDANAALAELDQGLRSGIIILNPNQLTFVLMTLLKGRLGEQSEAIVRFPRLFAKFPFPILINSALLKLADVFRQGPNFIKLCVLRVIQQSERHLDKITNVDEFVKRVHTVLYSNDPIARALTLRVLGSIATIIPERKQIHHNLRNALDSHDSVELHAAIFAAGRFAAQSKTFSMNMCSKISEMICGYATPLEMKLKLIPIFQHMHHDAQTAQTVRQTCLEMLSNYPSKKFVSILLHTMTLLSTHTLVDVPDQVELLLQYLNHDPRLAIKKRAIMDLRLLAKEDLAHLWSDKNIASIISFALENCPSDNALVDVLNVFCDVIKYTSIEKLSLENSNSPIIKLCETACYTNNLGVVAKGAMIISQIGIHCKKDMHHIDGINIMDEAVMAIESLFLLMSTGSKVEVNVLKECLQCIVLLCSVHPEACDQFVDIVGGMLMQSDEDILPHICNLLAALGNIRTGVLNPLLHSIYHQIRSVCEQPMFKERNRVLNLLANLLFQTMLDHKWPEEADDAMMSCQKVLDSWSVYKMARGAARYGHHGLADKLFCSIAADVSSESFFYWIKGVRQICKGESILNDTSNISLIERVTEANSVLLMGASSLKAAANPIKTQEFQITYVNCRSEMLQAMQRLLLACNSLRTSPPPAIASSLAKQSNDDLQRCGRVTQILRQCVKDFMTVGNMYSDLYQTAFDADPDTLDHLQLMQQLNSCLAQWIEMSTLRGTLQGSMYQDSQFEFVPSINREKQECSIELQSLIKLGERIALCFDQVPKNIQPINDIHTDCLTNVVTILASAGLCFPRFFFQSLQQTHLKVAVTPQARSAGEPIAVSALQQLAVKVEGVIISSKASNAMRNVDSVLINLSSNLVAAAKSQQGHEIRKICESPQKLEEKVQPHNDYFTAQFLVSFPVAGSHQVTIETQFQDSDNRVWRTGQKTCLNIKAFEDPLKMPSFTMRRK